MQNKHQFSSLIFLAQLTGRGGGGVRWLGQKTNFDHFFMDEKKLLR